jgi:hypothetical protein
VPLCAKGIDLSEPSLVRALSNSDPTVRGLAALELISDRHFEDELRIESALSAESDDRARIEIAYALASAGFPAGAAHLEKMCMDASLPFDVYASALRQFAAAQLVNPGRILTSDCADLALTKLENATESYQRDTLVSLLPLMFHEVPQDEADRMIADAKKLLSYDATRVAARNALELMQRAPR